MPVFTQICSADPATETTVTLATCTCACLTEGDMIIDSAYDTNSNIRTSLFIRIDGVIHWSNCALYLNATNSNFSLTGDNAPKNAMAMALLKQQQQQKVIGGLAVLRKPPVSSLPRRNDPFAPVRLSPTRTSHLYAGSRFRGKQKSGTVSYDVMVDIKMRFKPFEPMIDTFASEKFKYDFKDKDVIFMRWKEHFLVPDHRVEGINGASFAGFYYICYNKSTGEIDGYYFHRLSEKFQKLMLTHVEDQPLSFGSYEFR
ncbi:hypothetical protein BGZ80_003956 [Entomortierella chlamydospora]|uniref:Vacuolar import and degradation protein n=1 Tax=Entomortierella chlamydospora TaxID=101097 RepID=A0A9P6N1P0_9FUNG|nr:hypothetical protein BGZ79_001702 [Entomortierella chlamydospora]KAG0020585.1 hypothetical protein BGZ80_003956 [Entomortierella chlamydospora]